MNTNQPTEKPRAVAIKLDKSAMKKIVGGTTVSICPVGTKAAGRAYLVL
ncbi:MAG TPA: hypothetical protein VGL81_32660 [Polyangiaceae bacterium]